MNYKIDNFHDLLPIVLMVMLTGCTASRVPHSAAADSGEAVATVTTAKSTIEKQDQEHPLICRTIKPTGSRFGERICMTQKKWAAIAAESKQATDRMQRGGMLGQPVGGEPAGPGGG